MASPLLGPARVRALLAAHGLRPSKALGQHYLADPNTARKVVRLAGVRPGQTVLEVGPGIGSLTLALREAGARVVAVELDPRVMPALEEVLAGDLGVTVVLADALRADLAALLTGAPPIVRGTPSGSPGPPRRGSPDPSRSTGAPPWGSPDPSRLVPEAGRLVANLPYNIAAPLVLRVLAEFPAFTSITVMVQREVGERLAAPPGSPSYGAPSVKVAALAEARVLGPISRHVFIPEPHVDSVVIGLRRRVHPALEGLPFAALASVVDAAFSSRRKTLRNALRRLGLDPATVEAAGRAAGVDLALRAELLDVAAFAALTRALR